MQSSYPEIFPREQLYTTKAQLKKLLKDLCIRPEKVRNRNKEQEKERYSKYTWSSLKEQWDSVLLYVCFLYIINSCVISLYITKVFIRSGWMKLPTLSFFVKTTLQVDKDV